MLPCAQIFYKKVLRDEVLEPFFENVSIEKLKQKQVGGHARWGSSGACSGADPACAC